MSETPGVEPFKFDGGSTAVLLIHGFTGSPASMRPWGEYLAEQGYTVQCPLLPGHGTVWQDMAKTTWRDWYDTVQQTFDELAAEYETVFVGGLSMGGALALRLAQERGDAISGLMLVNPAVCRPQRLDVPVLVTLDQAGLFGLVSTLMPTVPGIKNDIKKPDQDELAYSDIPVKSALQLIKLQDSVRARLGDVTQPMTVFWSPEDHVVEPINHETVMKDVSSARRTLIRLENSYHVATLDYDADDIFTESLDFIQRILGEAGK